MAEKYRIQFKSREGQDCVVRFDFASFSGTSTTILGGDRPFLLREYNTDENVFKSVRPQQAEINIVTDSSGVTIDDFIADTDQEITVFFDFGTWTNYWIGYLLQDDFQEVWQDTYHIITLRASDYIGQLKNISISDGGAELIGRFTPWAILGYALDNTPQSLVRARVINNLFHNSMTSGLGNMPLNQCLIDAKTFQQAVDKYDDSYTVLEKINKSFNQTLFMYDGYWRFVRIEELYRPFTENFNEVYLPLTGPVGANLRYDANIGVNESIKPVSPDMMRFIIRRTKSDTIDFNYVPFEEILTNESFERGTLTTSTSTEDTYTLSYWDHKSGTPYVYVPLTSGSGRKITYDAVGQTLENFAFLVNDTLNSEHFIISQPIQVKQGETFSISFEKRYSVGFGSNSTLGSGYVRLSGASDYWLQDDGTWKLTTATQLGQVTYNGSTGISPTEYQSIQIDSQPLPIDGTITVYLSGPCSTFGVTSSMEVVRFQNLKINVQPTFGNFINNRLKGMQSVFTKSANIVNNFEDEIYMDDFSSEFYKGSIFESDGTTLTDKKWSRDKYPSEQLGFRKQNAIAYWEHDLFNRNKIDANFYGLTWQRSGTSYPLGLINTFKFVDDDPNKVYWILNLKEIDFSNSTWSATLVEMFDENKDGTAGYELLTFSASNITGYVLLSGETKLKYTITSAANFTGNAGNDEFTFNGTTPIITTILCTFNLDILNINPSFPNAVFKLKLNGTDIATDTIDCSSGTPLTTSVNLNTSGSITINNGDILTVTMSSNIGDVDVNSGSMSLSYYSIIPPSYDTYEDKFIYQ